MHGGKKASFSEGPYSFKSMTEADLPLLFRWINEPHVKQWWDSEDSWEPFYKRYFSNIHSEDSFPYIVSFDQQPMGYINYWNVEGDPNFSSLFPKASVGTDQFIGEIHMIGKGHGSKMIETFTDWMFRNDGIEIVMTDPHILNVTAIKCYQKAKFKAVKEMGSEEGPILLMVRRKNEFESDKDG